MAETKFRWDGIGDPPYYVITWLPRADDGSTVLDPQTKRIRPVRLSQEELLEQAFRLIDEGLAVAKASWWDFHLSTAGIREAYAKRGERQG